jgi:hypothetical protein
MIIRSRLFLLLGLLTLLSGCAQVCAYPDALAEKPAGQCFYHLVVTNIDKDNSTITAEFPPELNHTNPHKPSGSYTFRIREFDALKNVIKADGKTPYYFLREGNAAALDVFYGTPKGIDQDSYKASK